MTKSNKSRLADGRRDGYREGAARGWRDGSCLAIAAAVRPQPGAQRALRVVYVPQGFEAIDEGVVSGLRCCAAEVHIAEPGRMAETAASVRPDLMLVLNGLHTFPHDHAEQAEAVRALGVRTAIWFADDPYETAGSVRIAPHYDTVITHELAAVELYRRIGCRDVHHLPFGAHIDRFRPMQVSSAYHRDICFIGQGFWNRTRLFDAVAEELGRHNVLIAGGLWDRMQHYDKLAGSVRMGWLPVTESIHYYNGAKIVINVHRTTEPGSDNHNELNVPGRSVNPRTFEIAACGVFQLTDVRDDLGGYYKPGAELETFDGPEQLAAKIRYYLQHDEERNRIAARGLLRTLRDHTYPARVSRLLDMIGYPAG